MRIKLLNAGGYIGSSSGVNFPVEVEAYPDDEIPDGSAVFVTTQELIRVGGCRAVLELSDTRYFVDDEFEAIS